MSSVLIIEDDQALLDMYTAILVCEHDNIVCTQALTVEQAHQDLLAQSFDCILLDHYLPGMNGLDFFKELKLAKQAPKTILITSDDSQELKENAKKLGIYQIIIKGKDTQNFAETLTRYVSSTLSEN